MLNKTYLQSIAPDFREFMETEGEQWNNERAEKRRFLRENLSPEALPELDEGTLRQMLHHLWSFTGWTNKEYPLQDMLTSGLPEIRKAIKVLHEDELPMEKRFDYVRDNVRRLGAAAISELLSEIDPENCTIWNRRARQGLLELGVPEDNIPKSSQISGKQYAVYCELMKDVLGEVQTTIPEVDSFFSLNLLLYYLSMEPEIASGPEEPATDFDHDSVVEQVSELGDGLGFEVRTEVNFAPGCRVDVMWRTRVANLGTISYAFEVHRRGSRDSAILNLQKVLKQQPSTQKVVLISTEEQIEKFKREISGLGEDFRTAVGYFSVDMVEAALRHIGSLKDILNVVGLMKIDRVL